MEMINHQFWAGKKVFITGHTGFKGGWLTLWLHKMGAKVVGYSLPAPSTPSFFEAVGLEKFCEHHIGDIRNYDLLKNALDKANPDIVIHMAAQALVRHSYSDPIETYSTNVLGTVHLLEAVRHNSAVKACVIVTTDKCYENKEWTWGYREVDRLGGHDPYSNSKACAELVTTAYFKSFFQNSGHLGLASARAGNVIGGGDFADDRLVPDIYRAILSKSELNIRYPGSTRPWQHVLVPLSGYLTLAENLYKDRAKYSEAFNFGPKDEDCISVGELVEITAKHWGRDLPVKLEKNAKLHEAKFLKLDVSKAAAVLKWYPKWDVEKTIEETTRWYKAYLEQNNVLELSLEQISSFESY
jgi:CDP-glucose 4,6-dehydratase